MPEKKETVPAELAGLRGKNRMETYGEYYVPDYVMRDFGETEEPPSPPVRTPSQRSGAEFLL